MMETRRIIRVFEAVRLRFFVAFRALYRVFRTDVYFFFSCLAAISWREEIGSLRPAI